MAEHDIGSIDTKAGTAGGLLFVVLLRFGSEELLKTVLLSAVGALVSYYVSMGMRWAWKQLGQK